MSNHSPDYDDEMRDAFLTDTLRKAQERLTERYPEGKMTEQDEGAIHFAIGTKEGKVVIQFASSVAWIGMPPEQAMEMAQLLIKHARSISNTPFTLQVG